MHISESLAYQRPAVLVLCFLVTAIPLYYASWQLRSSHQPSAPSYAPYYSDDFVEQWLEASVIAPFDGHALKQYCKASKWRPNLIFNLADANGGIGNVRGNVLDFILYAIEAGASIVLPSQAARNAEDLSNVWSGRAPLSTFFDEQWFLQAMNEACPEMTIYQEVQDAMPGQYEPKSRKMYNELELTKAAYLQHLNQWLQAQEGYNADNITVVNVGRTLWNFDTRGLPRGVRRAMGQLLHINPDIRRIAALVVQQLAAQYKLDINPQVAMPKNMFLGAHLRTEADAAKAGWLNAPNTNFSAQTDAYMQQAIDNKLRVLYVASGDAAQLEQFKAKAAVQQLNVTSKLDLLSEEQLNDFQKLTWDQQALVDYEVLQRCSVFGGFVRSSFSYNIAMTRNQWLEDRALVSDPWLVLHTEEAVAFDDGYSRIIGRDEVHESWIPRAHFISSPWKQVTHIARNTMSQYFYKILEHAPTHPLPQSLESTSLDAQDGFIHLSTAKQVPVTADLFFVEHATIWLLKLRIRDLDGDIQYVAEAETGYPHLHNSQQGLGQHNIEEVLRIDKGDHRTWAEITALQELED